MVTNIQKIVNYIAISSPIILSFIIIIISFYLKNKSLLLFIALIILSGLINRLLKEVTKCIYAEYDEKGKITSPVWGIRPDPCGKIEDECLGCGVGIEALYDNDGFRKKIKEKLEKNEWGFPSGHAQFAFMCAVFWTNYLIHKDKTISKKTYYFIVLIWLSTILICYQRYHSKCHNPTQLVAGSFVGILLGYTFYRLYKRYI